MKILRNIMKSHPSKLEEVISLNRDTRTPLHRAVEGGNLEFCRIIVEYYYPGFARTLDRVDGTPLHLAVSCGRCDIVRLLLSYGHPEICFVRDEYGRMPIHFAAIEGQHWVLHELLHHDHSFHHHGAALSKQHCADLLSKTVKGDNAVHLCIKYGKLKALKLIVDYCLCNDYGVVLNCKDRDGNTPLRVAENIHGRDMIVEYLLHRLKRRREDWNQVWYRSTIFRLFDYDEEWIKDVGGKVQTMTSIALGACMTVIVCLLGFKETELADENVHTHRRYLLNDISICWVFGLPMVSVYHISGTHLWRNIVYRTFMIVFMGVIIIYIGFSLIEILWLASMSYETSRDVLIYLELWSGWVVIIIVVLVLRFVRFVMELRE